MSESKADKRKHVFLSYSKKDLWEYRAIYNELRLSGVRLWVDEDLEPGTTNWEKSLYRALKDSACLVCLCSPNSSKSGWVTKELECALELDLPVYPVIVAGTRIENILPPVIKNIQASDCRRDYFQTIHRFLAEITSRHPETQSFDLRTFNSNDGINWANLGSLFWFSSEVRKIRLILRPEKLEKNRIQNSLHQLKHHASRLNADEYTMRDLDHIISAFDAMKSDLSKVDFSRVETKLRNIQDNIALPTQKLDPSFTGGPFGGAPISVE